VDLLGRLDHDLLDLVLLLGLEADGDGEDAVVVARCDVVRVEIARQRQAAGEGAIPELGAVLALSCRAARRGWSGGGPDRDLVLLGSSRPARPDRVVVTLVSKSSS
jgi:hypothetical protein